MQDKALKNKRFFLYITILVTLFISGCEKKQIFVNPKDYYNLKPLKEEELENDTYYIKDGTKFYKSYFPENGVSLNAEDRQKIYWFEENKELIPSLSLIHI